MKNTEVKSSNGNRFYVTLESMKVGRTTVINGDVVTRWGVDAYEIGTWGKSQISIHNAVEALMAQ